MKHTLAVDVSGSVSSSSGAEQKCQGKTGLGLAARRLPLPGSAPPPRLPSQLVWVQKSRGTKITCWGRLSIGWPARSSKPPLGSAATGKSVSAERRAMLLAGVLGGKRTNFLQRTSAVHETPRALV